MTKFLISPIPIILLYVSLEKSKALVKFSKNWSINEAYRKLTSSIEKEILECGDLPQLQRACIREIKGLDSNLPNKLIPQIEVTSSVNGLLDTLTKSEYWNWFDTRLLTAVTVASGSPEARKSLEKYKAIYYSKKVSDLILCEYKIKSFKNFVPLVEKYKKDPKKLTILDLQKHQYEIEKIVEGGLVLIEIKTGCVELTWQIPQELFYRAYTSMKRKHDELSSLAVKSLVCEEADAFAGLPILWHGQEVGEVVPIEPLPEHVRQEPYSLPQGFHWVILSSSNVEEVVKFLNKFSKQHITTVFDINFTIKHPTAKDEWQFGIRTTNGKLVGVVLGHPVCISIQGVSLACIRPCTGYHPKYRDKRIYYILIKELMRRVNLYDINHLVLTQVYNSILKPVITTDVWSYSFDYPTSNPLPNLPRTPGWRRMTSEDVPSALAIINKWSSQFEIRQVFNSEEEFSYVFLCPTEPNYVFTYVVENKTKSITDLISFKLENIPHMPTFAYITTVVSTQSPVKQLIIDALVCAKNMGAKELRISQSNTKSDVLLSIPFQCGYTMKLLIYNYKYREVPATDTWYLGF